MTSVRAMTPNQVVAYNLRRARALRGWTQTHAAKEIEPYIGSLWSKATFSAAERFKDGDHIRQFTADDIFAFALAFNLPITWFFVPPSEGFSVIRPGDAYTSRRGAVTSQDTWEVLDRVFAAGWVTLEGRLDEFLAWSDSPNHLAWYRSVALFAGEAARHGLAQAMAPIRNARAALQDLEKRLENAEDLSSEALDELLARDFGLDAHEKASTRKRDKDAPAKLLSPAIEADWAQQIEELAKLAREAGMRPEILRHAVAEAINSAKAKASKKTRAEKEKAREGK